MTLELENVAGFELGFDQVQALRDLLDSVLSLGSYCNGALRVVRVLQESDISGLSSLRSSLEVYSTQLLDCVESVFVLRSRMSNLIDLYAYALDAKNQYTVTETNKGMEVLTRKTNSLTEKTADLAEKSTMDNTVIKWITLVSLFYLPGSFVTSLFGMNFFTFNQETMRIVVAEDIWIYVATWLPLTLLTLLGYGVVVLLVKPPERRWHWLSQRRSGRNDQTSIAEMIKRYE